jgi:hypothetical protein
VGVFGVELEEGAVEDVSAVVKGLDGSGAVEEVGEPGGVEVEVGEVEEVVAGGGGGDVLAFGGAFFGGAGWDGEAGGAAEEGVGEVCGGFGGVVFEGEVTACSGLADGVFEVGGFREPEGACVDLVAGLLDGEGFVGDGVGDGEGGGEAAAFGVGDVGGFGGAVDEESGALGGLFEEGEEGGAEVWGEDEGDADGGCGLRIADWGLRIGWGFGGGHGGVRVKDGGGVIRLRGWR